MNGSVAWIVLIAAVVLAALVAAVLVTRRRRRTVLTPTALYIRALDALLAGDEPEALALLKEAVRGDSNNIHAYIKLGTLFRNKGEITRSIRIHREVTLRPRVEGPDLELALQELALDYRAQGNTAKALATLEQLRRENAKNLFAYQMAAELMEQQEQWDRAYEFRKQLSRIREEDDGRSLAVFQAHVGREMAQRGDVKAAQDHFKEAFRRDRQSLPAYLYAGDLKYQQGKPEHAIEMWKDVVRLHPERASWVYERLEKAYFDLGQFETMMDIYDEVLKTRPDDIRTLVAVAQLHHKKGDLEEVERTLSQILEQAPKQKIARLYLGLIHAEREGNEAAAKVLGELLEEEIRTLETFLCSNCGHRSDEMLWHCPRCSAWESYSPEVAQEAVDAHG